MHFVPLLSEEIKRSWVGIAELGLDLEGVGGEVGGWNLLPSEEVCSQMNRWFAGWC